MHYTSRYNCIECSKTSISIGRSNLMKSRIAQPSINTMLVVEKQIPLKPAVYFIKHVLYKMGSSKALLLAYTK